MGSESPFGNSDENSGEAGTTLVELLVAMALLSLIALFIGEGVLSVRAGVPLAARLEGSVEIAAARDHLRRTLGEAVADLALGGAAPFEGGPEALAFLAPADPVLEIGGLNHIVLGLEPGSGGHADLVERRAAARGGLAGGARRTVLVSGVEGLGLSYAGPSPGDGEPAWRPEWHEAGVLPALVRIELRLARDDRRRFPPLLVHPFASPAPAGAGLGQSPP